MMPRYLLSIFLSLAFLMQACSGTHDKNMSKLDELHGEDGLHILKSLPKPIREQAISNITG